jgi:hypothetical protein
MVVRLVFKDTERSCETMRVKDGSGPEAIGRIERS